MIYFYNEAQPAASIGRSRTGRSSRAQMEATSDAAVFSRDVVDTVRVNIQHDNKYNKIVQIIDISGDNRSNIYKPGSPLRLPMLDHANDPIDVAPMLILTYNYVRAFLAAWDTVSATVTKYCGHVLVGAITTALIVAIEGLDTGVLTGDSNMTVKDVVNSFMVFQNCSIETYNNNINKKKKKKLIGMNYSDLLHLFSCSTIKAIQVLEYKKYQAGSLKFSVEELAAYDMRLRVPIHLRRRESASLLYAALRAGGEAADVVKEGEINYAGLLTLCQHRLKRMASDAELEEPEAKRYEPEESEAKRYEPEEPEAKRYEPEEPEAKRYEPEEPEAKDVSPVWDLDLELDL